ncbi:MAG TPA: MBL fold metallo-hydrolase [Myxococcota bacterium]|nr:MBL fold metallo-hydrolase [Myxococcota bacterium]
MSSERDPLPPTGPVTPLRRAPVPALPKVHQLVLPTPWEVGPVQIYLLEGDPLTLIDSGVRSPASREALEAGLADLGHRPADVRRLVLTHYHGDHLGQAQSLRDWGADLEVFAHREEAPMIEAFSAERDENIDATNDLFREYGVPDDLLAKQTAVRRRWLLEDPLCAATRVDHAVEDGASIEAGGLRLEVIHAPGHTAGHILLHEPESGALFTGDHLMGDAVPFTDTYLLPGAPGAADPLARRPRFRGLPAYLASLRALRRRSFSAILPAHGGVIERPARAIDEAILFYDVRVQRVQRALARLSEHERSVTAWEIWQQLFPKADPVLQMRTRMLMVIGALDLLEDAGALEVARNAQGILVHQPL